jgi:hypothetical protein
MAFHFKLQAERSPTDGAISPAENTAETLGELIEAVNNLSARFARGERLADQDFQSILNVIAQRCAQIGDSTYSSEAESSTSTGDGSNTTDSRRPLDAPVYDDDDAQEGDNLPPVAAHNRISQVEAAICSNLNVGHSQYVAMRNQRR